MLGIHPGEDDDIPTPKPRGIRSARARGCCVRARCPFRTRGGHRAPRLRSRTRRPRGHSGPEPAGAQPAATPVERVTALLDTALTEAGVTSAEPR